MPSPGPFYTSDLSDVNREHALLLARTVGLAPFTPGVDATGSNLDKLNSVCKSAGLTVGWLALKARAVTVNKSIGCYIGGVPGAIACPEQFDVGAAQSVRAWALEYADDLVDVSIKQTAEAASNWGWW